MDKKIGVVFYMDILILKSLESRKNNVYLFILGVVFTALTNSLILLNLVSKNILGLSRTRESYIMITKIDFGIL